MLGPKHAGYVALYTPTKFSGTMVNYGGATASAYLYVKEHNASGVSTGRTWSGEVFSCTRTGSFSYNLSGYGLAVDLKNNYLYRVHASMIAWAHSGPTVASGGLCDISSGQLKAIVTGYN